MFCDNCKQDFDGEEPGPMRMFFQTDSPTITYCPNCVAAPSPESHRLVLATHSAAIRTAAEALAQTVDSIINRGTDLCDTSIYTELDALKAALDAPN